MRVALAALALMLVASPALAGDPPTIPAEWQGIWELSTTTIIPCEFGSPMQSTSTDTLCAGDLAFDDDGGGLDVVCTGTVTSTTVDMTCTSMDEFDGCVVSIVTTYSGTRTNDTYSLTSISIATAEDPDVCGFEEFCTEVHVTGTRTSTDPSLCTITPIEERSWGAIKTTYR